MTTKASRQTRPNRRVQLVFYISAVIGALGLLGLVVDAALVLSRYRVGQAVLDGAALAQSQCVLGLLAANLINTIDPEMIVIGGGVTERLGDKFVAPIRQIACANLINKTNARAVKIVPAALKDASGVVGAAVLAREHL